MSMLSIELIGSFLLIGIYAVGFLTGLSVGRHLASKEDLVHAISKKRSHKVVPFKRVR